MLASLRVEAVVWCLEVKILRPFFALQQKNYLAAKKLGTYDWLELIGVQKRLPDTRSLAEWSGTQNNCDTKINKKITLFENNKILKVRLESCTTGRQIFVAVLENVRFFSKTFKF
jgi:hypothetical protein